MKKLVPFLSLALAAVASANPTVPPIFGDNMVLQQATKVPVWGKADPEERIDVDVAGQRKLVYAGKDGRWSVEFHNLPLGGPYTMTVKGKTTLTFKNVLVGEVWVASGQSNMEMTSTWLGNRQVNLGKADFPEIRFFAVERNASGTPQEDFKGRWVVCDPETMKYFSMVGFFFARRLYTELHQPIGIVGTYWGGTPAEAWTRMSSLETFEDCKSMVDHYRAISRDYEGTMAEYRKKLAEWQDKALFKDTGNRGEAEGWAKADLDDSNWLPIPMPAMWENSGKSDLDIDGIVWFRRAFDLPADWNNRDLILSLGSIDDYDITYVNGVKVGETPPGTENSWMKPRIYTIPASVLKPGRNVVAVRAYDSMGAGGFGGGPLQIVPEGLSAGPMKIEGEWRYKVEAGRPTLPQSFFNAQPQQPYGPGSAVAPSNLWNGMVNPLIPYAFKGAIWYQGESNADRAYQYRSLFPGMIRDWRMAWGRGDFPFYFVQLANFMNRKDEPEESAWAELREAQTMTLRLRNTGMAVAIDIGEAGDIHPRDKENVGERLARWALARDYAKTIEASGPLYKGSRVEGNRVRIFFTHAESGLASMSGDALKGFAIAGEDKKFVWAQAKIEGNAVVVWSPSVAKPLAVRYAWANNPACNLINKAGLPASPFRTDSWAGVTINNR